MFTLPVQMQPSTQGSRADGLGVFVQVPVTAGAVVWREALGWDTVVPAQDNADLDMTEAFRTYLHTYARRRTWGGRDSWVLPVDEARFINSATGSQPGNLREDPSRPGTWCAITDLAAGQELRWCA